MAATTQQAITGNWQKVSDSDCTMQSETPNTLYDISVGVTAPSDSASPPDARIIINLGEPKTFAYKSPVWVRLNAKGSVGQQRVINIIK